MTTGPVYDPNGTRRAPLRPVSRPAGSYGDGSGAGAGFQYDEATLHELVREWQELADEFRADFAQAEALVRAKGPGLEYASGNNAELIRASGKSLSSTLQERARYCESMVAKYVAALGKYAAAEEAHVTEIGNTTKGTL
ncbi:hypothetical protein SAMN05421837_105592 [Amycolatopsis pretoriensis]|uniref:PE family protein n=1 Tax=Amycolatopsis pretoriensis TaxID=218821 RepID=A0A1H5QY88_9PSEU|nr:hypothetical protein [Amycolatopsis pretoriensis]SEF31116.1 hypothetical protein SAMN05421837_105592 [Amycolatopsis pretoriensis]